MAKGNLFLGTAARSVGDVVMYRREGSQVSRVRVRKIANPKTDAQCEQRAFMSAVVKFYQPLANVLDRSWQGLSRAKSYAKFLKTNVGIVRAGGYYLPKDSGFFPLPLQLSNGTIAPINYQLNNGAAEILFMRDNNPEFTFNTIGDLSSAFVFMGYQNGDVVSFIWTALSANNAYSVKSAQFIIDTTSTARLDSAFSELSFNDVTEDTGTMTVAAMESFKAFAIIIARPVDGQWQRSKQILTVDSTILATITTAEAKAAAIASYKGAAASDNPLVYLDGDELDNA